MIDHKITYLDKVHNPKKCQPMNLKLVLDHIKNGLYKTSIEEIRKLDKKSKESKNRKQALPAICLHGVFKEADTKGFVEGSGILGIDIDNLSELELARVKKTLENLPYVLFFFESPNRGIKGGIRIKKVANDQELKSHFNYAIKELKSQNIKPDESCSDLARKCFVSYDPNLYYNQNASLLELPNLEKECINRVISVLDRWHSTNRHTARLKAGRLAGGYIAGSLVSESAIFSAIKAKSDSISETGETSASELKTITDGIKDGKSRPITDISKSDQHLSVFLDCHDDYEETDIYVDLLSHIDYESLPYRLSIHLSELTNIPVNSCFLMTLGVFSSMASRRYCTSYESKHRLPIGLYVAAEQPPGAAKSRCISELQRPFIKHTEGIINKDSPVLFISNATPEGVEKSLLNSRGLFSSVSSERGLLDSFLGSLYSSEKAKNNDVLLNGFDGGNICVLRVTRIGYSGPVCGSIVCFAQPGTVEQILESSNGTGVSERFLFISEDHLLGKRDHVNKVSYNHSLMDEYKAKCEFITEAFFDSVDLYGLKNLEITRNGFRLINEYRNSIEPLLADGNKLSTSNLRGAAGKVDMQIMKIAATLQCFDDTRHNTIDDKYIVSAIGIAGDLLELNYHLNKKKGVIGEKSESDAIFNYLNSKGGFSLGRALVNSMRTTKPFKEMSGSKTDAIKQCIDLMRKKDEIFIDGKMIHLRK